MRAPALLVILATLLAGCAAPLTPDASTTLAADAAPELAPLGLAGTGCLEGGGHSVHPRSLWESGFVSVVPEPWVPADVWEDVGDQFVFSEIPDPARPVPAQGNTMGNYHATLWCSGWTLDGETRSDVFVGFVGMRVEPPAFDADAAAPTHHYLVTVVATNDDVLLERLRAGGIAAFAATAERVELPSGTLRIRMWTDGNGEYDSLFTPMPHGDMHATHVRLWWQHEPDAHGGHADHTEGAHRSGAFHPVALDMRSTGGTHHVEAAQGYFSHSGTDHHAPLPGAYGHTAGVLYRDFDRVFEWGPRPDVVLEKAYVH